MRMALNSKYLRWELPNNKHAWAFYYYCKRQGDWVCVAKQNAEEVTLIVRLADASNGEWET